MPYDLRSGEAAHNRPVNPHPLNHAKPVGFGEWGECYSCEDCYEVDNSTQTEICPYYQYSLPGCITFSGTDLTKLNGETVVIRACANTLGYCEAIRKKYSEVVDVVSCTECYQEKCNTIEVNP